MTIKKTLLAGLIGCTMLAGCRALSRCKPKQWKCRNAALPALGQLFADLSD
ncbi:hypothetical protein DEV91_101533 [Phyllobacterium brassicacearum]|nr:hypothetical protein DEV91_101533 [Phyllobacterium brassicacearum]